MLHSTAQMFTRAMKDIWFCRPKRYLHSRKSSLPEKLQLIQKDPEKLLLTVEEKSDASSGNSGFEVISLAASPSAGTNVEQASFTFKFFGNGGWIICFEFYMNFF